MKKIFLLIIVLLGILIPTKGQVVNYGDSNYMAVIYTPNPPITPCGSMGSALSYASILARPKRCIECVSSGYDNCEIVQSHSEARCNSKARLWKGV
jgi:hypothetical protein